MTGAEFYAYVLRTFKRTDKETEIYEAMTDVIMDLKLKYYFEDFKEEAYTAGIAVLGDYKISLPTDFGHLIGNVVLIDEGGTSKPLTKLTKSSFDERHPDIITADAWESKPECFCIYSGQIFLGPRPDSIAYVYQINYTTEEATEITSGTAAVPFTSRYRKTLRQLVVAEVYRNMGRADLAAVFEAQAGMGVTDMIANEDYNTDALDVVNYQDI